MEIVLKVFYFVLQTISLLQKTWRKDSATTLEKDAKETIIYGLELEGSDESRSVAEVIRNSKDGELPDIIEKAEKTVREKVKARGVGDSEMEDIIRKMEIGDGK